MPNRLCKPNLCLRTPNPCLRTPNLRLRMPNSRFRTPSLRNVAVTAPYMHDGSIATLHEVLRTHYARAGRAVHAGRVANPLRSEFIAGFEISETEIADLVAFLESLTDERILRDPAHQSPWSSSAR